jgi:hypothetical protein
VPPYKITRPFGSALAQSTGRNDLEQHCGPSYSSTAFDAAVIATWFFQQ